MILKLSSNLPRGQTAPPFLGCGEDASGHPGRPFGRGGGESWDSVPSLKTWVFEGRGEQSSLLCKTGRQSIQSRPPQAKRIHTGTSPLRCPHSLGTPRDRTLAPRGQRFRLSP